MGIFVNPFAKNDLEDFKHVLVPLSDATRRASDSDGKEKSLEKASSQEDGVSLPPDQYSAMTIEALRAEVESDVAASGHDTAYDRM